MVGLRVADQTFPTSPPLAEIGDFHENGNWFHHPHIRVITRKGLDRGYLSKGYCNDADLPEIKDLCPSPAPLSGSMARGDNALATP
jgi:hypothetical protein